MAIRSLLLGSEAYPLGRSEIDLGPIVNDLSSILLPSGVLGGISRYNHSLVRTTMHAISVGPKTEMENDRERVLE